jgi:nifR3 family TIM-barrel protein
MENRTAVNADVAPTIPGEFAPLTIGDMSVWPPVVLAPMAGVTDSPFRTLCREFSSAGRDSSASPSAVPGLFVSQMITARGLVEGHAKTLKLAEFAPGESPRSMQLYGTDPVYLAKAVELLVGREHVDHIDLNFGCPVPKVTRHGGGGALPFRRPLFARIVGAVVEAAAGRVPVTVKFRMGIDDEHLTHLDAGRIAEAAGVAAIALHARTVEQLYGGDARWEAIAELKAHVRSIPVLGNGDIWEAHDALRMLRATGADGVVIGRGCLGRPWLFTQLSRLFDGHDIGPLPQLGSVAATMARHAGLVCEWTGGESSLRSFRKHATWYLAGFPVGGAIRDRLHRVSSLGELDKIIADLDPTLELPVDALRIPRSHRGGPKPVTLPPGWLDDPDCDLALSEEAGVMVSGG